MSRQIGVLLGIAVFVSILNYQIGYNFDLGKKEFVSDIHASTILNNSVKAKMVNEINKLTAQSQDSHKDDVLNKIEQEKENMLKTTPKNQQEAVAVKFDKEKSEIAKLIDRGTIKLKEKSSKAFSFTFISSSLFLILSLFFAFRTKPKQPLNTRSDV